MRRMVVKREASLQAAGVPRRLGRDQSKLVCAHQKMRFIREWRVAVRFTTRIPSLAPPRHTPRLGNSSDAPRKAKRINPYCHEPCKFAPNSKLRFPSRDVHGQPHAPCSRNDLRGARRRLSLPHLRRTRARRTTQRNSASVHCCTPPIRTCSRCAMRCNPPCSRTARIRDSGSRRCGNSQFLNDLRK